jgi:hypothetical protein
MVDNGPQVIDVAKTIPAELGSVIVASLLTAIFLRLSNRLTIRTTIPFKTAYLSSLATNTITFFISLMLGIVFVPEMWNRKLMYIPAMVVAVPICAMVYQRTIKDLAGSPISHKDAMFLSVVLFGISLGFAALLVGMLFAIGIFGPNFINE